MKVVALVDENVDQGQLRTRRGPWFRWYNAWVIDELCAQGHKVSVVQLGTDLEKVIESLRGNQPDLVFNLIDSAFGGPENAFFAPTLLEALQIPYTGPGPRGVLLGGDKVMAKLVLRHHHVAVPKFIAYPGATGAELSHLAGPVLIKPALGGGSVGIKLSSLVGSRADLTRRLKAAHAELGSPIICEEYVNGRELSVGVLERGTPTTLVPGEWVFPQGGPKFVTEMVKWNENYRKRHGIRHRPAKLSPEQSRAVSRLCIKVFNLLELRDYAAIDLRQRYDGSYVVLDANPNPGLWPGSVRWNTAPFRCIVAGIVKNALGRSRKVKRLVLPKATV